MKILLIDDHASFCEGLKAALNSVRPDFVVDYETDTVLVPQSLLNRHGYDLFIMDLTMPGFGGIELLRYLQASHNHTPVMVLSSVEDPETVKRVFELGAIGFLHKSYSVYQILAAIEECAEGNIHVPAFLAADRSGEPPGANDPESDTLEGADGFLTRRQMEIITLMDKGYSNQEIADSLCISKATVKTHLNHLFRYFNVNNRISCLRAAKKLVLTAASGSGGPSRPSS